MTPAPALVPAAQRTLVVWCPDWPVVAALLGEATPPGITASDPIAVMRANRVVACSASARHAGVGRGMRRREAQSRSPMLELVADDAARDARWFEPVLAALETYTPFIEVVRPGLCQFATRGPSRYFGGDAALVEQVHRTISQRGIHAQVGVADGPFAAALAARVGPSFVVDVGESQQFLAPQPISSLISSGADRLGDAGAHRRAGRTGGSRPGQQKTKQRAVGKPGRAEHPDDLAELVEMWGLLGLRTLGIVAQLPRVDVLERFGPFGLHAYNLARGVDEQPLDPTPIPVDLAATMELDPPIDRVDAAAFVAKGLAEELHARLRENGLACTRIRIEAHTGNGTRLIRLWRHERSGAAGGITAQGLADRVRWQLDGWLRRLEQEHATALAQRDVHEAAGRSAHRAGQSTGERSEEKSEDASGDAGPDPTADWDGSARALVRITLAPDEVHPETGRQLGFWGGASDADERAARVFTRLQGMLGPDAVCIPVATGSRNPDAQARLVPWGDHPDEVVRDGLERSTERPWPGSVPPPLPSTMHVPPLPADVRTEAGWPVQVSRRGLLDASPARLSVARSSMGSLGPAAQIIAWAGPWPIEERWWDPETARRRARLQVVLDDGRAHLLALEGGDWWVEATYD